MSSWSKIKKFKRMSTAELRQRVSQKLGQHRERRRWRRKGTSQFSTQDLSANDLLNRCLSLVPGYDPEQLSRAGENSNAVLFGIESKIRQQANSILHDHWTMLGHPFDLRGSVDWHVDPRTGYKWKRSFYADLPLYDLPGETDIKYPWELSRHQFLAELSRNFLLNRCPESSQRVRDLMIDWIDQNPVYGGVNWTSALEVAMRSISWIWALAGLATWDGWDEEDLSKIGGSLRDHGAYLFDNFSFYSSPYNHLIGEATGLLAISSLFNEGKTVTKWDRRARQVLLKSGPAQFYEDYFCVEQAVGYHYYTLGFLAFASLTARKSCQPLNELDSVIQSAFKTGAAFRRPDGTWPAIGDLDSARALPIVHQNYWSFDSLQNLAAVMFDDETLKTGDQPGEELLWLLGAEGVDCWERMHGEPNSQAHVFSDSGYAIASDKQSWFLLDAGPIAHGLFADATPSTAHGHADTMQVLFQIDHQNLLGDCGMPFYGGDPDWVSHFRSPAAHNCVQIEGVEYVRRAGRLAWSHQSNRPTMKADFSGSVWLAHAKQNWADVTHERHICCIPGQGIWVADLIESDRPRNATWFWQIPHNSIEMLSQSCYRWGSMELLSHSTENNCQLELKPFDPSLPSGWHCLGYGEKQHGHRLLLKQKLQNKCLVLTSVGCLSRPKLEVQLSNFRLSEAPIQSEEPGHQVHVFQDCRWKIPSSELVGIDEQNLSINTVN